MMAITLPKLLTIHHRFRQWDRPRPRLACRKPQSRKGLSNTSRLRDTWK
jgi:hypothetical protein